MTSAFVLMLSLCHVQHTDMKGKPCLADSPDAMLLLMIDFCKLNSGIYSCCTLVTIVGTLSIQQSSHIQSQAEQGLTLMQADASPAPHLHNLHMASKVSRFITLIAQSA